MKYILAFILAAMSFSCVNAQAPEANAEEVEAPKNVGSVAVAEGTENIKDSAFYKSIEMTSLSIPASVKSIGRHVVDHCFKLTEINVANDNLKFKSIDGVVFSKDGKTLVLCPSGKKGEYVVPKEVTTIASGAFTSCKKLTSIVLPAGLEEIPAEAFQGCWGLERINLPQGLKKIGYRAFDGTIIQKLNMPATMQCIDHEAFVNTSLVEVNLRVSEPFELGENVFSEIHVTRLNVPAAGLSKFKNHPKWGKFGRITPTHSYWTVDLP